MKTTTMINRVRFVILLAASIVCDVVVGVSWGFRESVDFPFICTSASMAQMAIIMFASATTRKWCFMNS